MEKHRPRRANEFRKPILRLVLRQFHPSSGSSPDVRALQNAGSACTAGIDSLSGARPPDGRQSGPTPAENVLPAFAETFAETFAVASLPLDYVPTQRA